MPGESRMDGRAGSAKEFRLKIRAEMHKDATLKQRKTRLRSAFELSPLPSPPPFPFLPLLTITTTITTTIIATPLKTIPRPSLPAAAAMSVRRRRIVLYTSNYSTALFAREEAGKG